MKAQMWLIIEKNTLKCEGMIKITLKGRFTLD